MVGNWKDNTSLSIDVAVIDPTCDTHAEKLASEGVGAAAAKYQARKRKTYEDIKGIFSPFVIEVHGRFGKKAKKLVRELERRRKERECRPNTRTPGKFEPLGGINLVTAIGFEHVRRNVRMILVRAPKEEPLVPSDRTKIRLEMVRKKGKVKLRKDEPYGCCPFSDTEVNAGVGGDIVKVASSRKAVEASDASENQFEKEESKDSQDDYQRKTCEDQKKLQRTAYAGITGEISEPTVLQQTVKQQKTRKASLLGSSEFLEGIMINTATQEAARNMAFNQTHKTMRTEVEDERIEELQVRAERSPLRFANRTNNEKMISTNEGEGDATKQIRKKKAPPNIMRLEMKMPRHKVSIVSSKRVKPTKSRIIGA